MLDVYFNYPNSQVTIHAKSGCASVRSHKKTGQRLIRIDAASLSKVLQEIKSREYRFASTAESNDLWVQVELQDRDLELAVVKHLHRQFSKYYKPFAAASLETHC